MQVPKPMSRREFLRLSGLAAGAAGITLSTLSTIGRAGDLPMGGRDLDVVLTQLLEGNKRFMRGDLAHPRRKPEDFMPLAEGQAPLTAVVCCADSRVAPELIFDQGVGDLFVVRVAGNVINGSGAIVKGSIEYAVAELDVRLIVVLGHSQCGAVKAAIKHIADKDAPPGSIGNLVDLIRPAVAAVKGKPGNILDNAIKANVEQGVERLTRLEPIVAGSVKKGTLKVVGAVYDLHSGKVTAFG
ncbi:carbonic anhydrase [Nitrospira sp. BLG_2]|uniref:carbonic anhydrase n=1 Tax=Nitrospira sp. BLG_2 TaxID=3397507 RepID=UPI003B9B7F0C